MASVYDSWAGEEKIRNFREEFCLLGGDIALSGAGGDRCGMGGAEEHDGSGFAFVEVGKWADFRGSGGDEFPARLIVAQGDFPHGSGA